MKGKNIKLFTDCVITKKEIIFTLAVELIPYLIFGDGNKTIIYVGFLKELRSKHSIRLYLFVSSFRIFHLFRINTTDLMRVFGFTDKYLCDFTRAVLKRGVKDINEKTDLKCSFAPLSELFSFYCRLKNDEELSEISEDWKLYTLEKEIELMESKLGEEFFV